MREVVFAPARAIGALLVLAALAALLGACGAEPPPETPITVAQAQRPGSLDPALASDPGELEAIWLVYTPLLTYRHAEDEKGTELIGGLAGDLPEISADGLTYTLALRDDLSYSDRARVRASDFEHAIKRVLWLRSDGAPFFRGIVGAERYLRGADPDADLEGIEADDRTGRITVRLTEPDYTFANRLALTFAAPVPADTPFEDTGMAPPPGVGPYEIADPQASGEFVLERNPVFADLDIPDIPTGNIATFRMTADGDERRHAHGVLDGMLDYMQGPPPRDLRPTIHEQASDRFAEHPAASTNYLFLNGETAPFDDPLVREAVNRAVDRRALARLQPGMQPGCSFLPPGVPGYDEALDTTACPYGDPTEPPDRARARALIRAADARGARVTVLGSDEAGARAITRAYAATLDAIGLDARTKLVAASDYERAISARSTRAETGLVERFASFPQPLDAFADVDGDAIRSTANPNPGNVDDPFIDSELDRLRAVAELDSATADWSALDRYLVSPPRSYVAPLGHQQVATFLSERVDPRSAGFHPVYRNDYSSWALKEGE
ncbi:MAG: hypothetical protein GEU88_15275 [Solirubrobacterales bacterium]|nr:hypothetical protein [Solirubrobacterales bacterium]